MEYEGAAVWLPLVWAGLLAVAVAMYVVIDGFDLGVGLLVTAARKGNWRDRMMVSAAPIWDGNDTWLELGGAGLFAVFSVAYAILLPALYLPLILLLIALIFRGVAFEFRFKADRSQFVWDVAFHYGSLVATFAQGMVLGAVIRASRSRAAASPAAPWTGSPPSACSPASASSAATASSPSRRRSTCCASS
jgi:cytochrome d ubiquinol oxidase subunit II